MSSTPPLAGEPPAYLLFGASGGIGQATARRLAAAGARVALASRASDRLDALAAELGAPAYPLDAADFDAVEACAAGVREAFGRLDGIANCVGSLLLKPAHLTKSDEWQQTLAANLTSAFAVVRGAAKTMPEGGAVVLMSSAAGRIGLANHEAIAAAKAGVIGLAKAAAATYARRGLRFNAIAPGLVKTPLTQRIWESERAAAASVALHPLGKLGEPADIASLIAWLLNPENRWITGEVISVDGGLSTAK
jgi:NAD(P)-dependent dehydrogenase (short-subunit alcohol dehydrogenase family)